MDFLHPNYFNKTIDAPKQNFYLISALRFLAALMAVCCHAIFYTQERLPSSAAFFGLGSNGVPLFFGISGFIIVLASQKSINDKNGRRKFATKRIIRIVLALITAAITYSFYEKPVSKLLNKKFLPKPAITRAEREVV